MGGEGERLLVLGEGFEPLAKDFLVLGLTFGVEALDGALLLADACFCVPFADATRLSLEGVEGWRL